MTSSVSRPQRRTPAAVAAGFLGAFVVGSLAVQLLRSQAFNAAPSGVEPVVASQATLWAPLGER